MAAARMTHNAYGKSSVLLTKVRRLPDLHELIEMKVKIRLMGDFERSYTHGDNSKVIATDSMKNTVYLLAKEHPCDSPEAFAFHLADHFVKTYPQVNAAEVHIHQSLWRRIDVDGIGHPTAFESAGNELRLANILLERENLERHNLERQKKPTILQGGLRDLLILKTTDSEFTDFVRDEFTTLADATDRILATRLCAGWSFDDRGADYNGAFLRIRKALLETFANHKSKAVQQTLYDMGTAALDAEPAISWINLTLPNQHRIPFNFKPFGKEFENDIYVTTDAPFGEISASIQRMPS